MPKNISIAVLGPPNTNTDLAAIKYEKLLQKKLKKIYLPTIRAVVKAVAEGHAEKGIIPLENSIAGRVKETRLFLKKYNIKTSRKFELSIQYALVILEKADKKNIKVIASHEQALQQCSRYLKKVFPHCIQKKYPSTISALEKNIATRKLNTACIIPLKSASNYPVKIIAGNIGNQKKNSTIFLVIEPAR